MQKINFEPCNEKNAAQTKQEHELPRFQHNDWNVERG